MPPGSPDEWGDLGRETDAGLRDLFARLDVEEADAGFESVVARGEVWWYEDPEHARRPFFVLTDAAVPI